MNSDKNMNIKKLPTRVTTKDNSTIASASNVPPNTQVQPAHPVVMDKK